MTYEQVDAQWVDLTVAYIKAAHHNQTDKSGDPYYLHPIRVMENLGPTASLHEKLAALLHDVVEDTPFTLDHLRLAGYHPDVLAAVNLLTRRHNVPYFKYIQNIIDSGNPIAIKVKLADLKDNMNPDRPSTAHIGSLAGRYEKAKEMLEALL